MMDARRICPRCHTPRCASKPELPLLAELAYLDARDTFNARIDAALAERRRTRPARAQARRKGHSTRIHASAHTDVNLLLRLAYEPSSALRGARG